MRKIPLATLLRFPIIFGGIILLGGVAFRNREYILNLKDIEKEREAMYVHKHEDVKLIEQCKIERKGL
ncbi:hypothetical protein ILUMI_21279 [Ignelater luminosus]|uniref:Uncharacterized protein n=1 Tax=Ignelater luminosus TaxID=2038154 RepID=A0A8K0G418_IGNLU|nr:hypothetical protein ILUMI_21279 [Ignelater luminosus]